MPRFTEIEKEKIREELLKEGERLFSSIGLRKVTIDNLSDAAGISHSAFYTFYKSKEELFMQITMMKKNEIYRKLRVLVENNFALPPKELVKLYIISLRESIFSDPIINSLDNSLKEYVSRRVSPELVPSNDLIDQNALAILKKTGIQFKYSDEYTVKATTAVFVGISCLDGDEDQSKIIDILIEGLIDKLIL